jgi:predicted dehydrogenase
VWDEDAQRGKEAAARLGVPFVEKLEHAIERSDVQAVTICSTNDMHADLAVAAARARKHMMVQKPMATTLADCDRIVEAVEAAGVLYYQSHNLRFDDVHQELKRRVDAGAVGRINLVRRRHSHAFALLNPKVLDWMMDAKQAGGGAFMDEGAHAALWFLWMFGAPRSVMGMVTTMLTQQQPGIEEAGVLLYRYDSGMIGIHQSSWTELAGPTTIEIYGDAGTIVVEGTDISSARSRDPQHPPLRIWRHNAAGPAGDPAATGPAPGYWEESAAQLPASRLSGTAQAFIDMLSAGGPSPCGARTARTAVAMVLAGYASAREGREVLVER